MAAGRAWLAATPAWLGLFKTCDTELPSADMLTVSVESYPHVHFTFDAVLEDLQPHAGWQHRSVWRASRLLHAPRFAVELLIELCSRTHAARASQQFLETTITHCWQPSQQHATPSQGGGPFMYADMRLHCCRCTYEGHHHNGSTNRNAKCNCGTKHNYCICCINCFANHMHHEHRDWHICLNHQWC